MCKSADITERQQDLICFLNKKYNSTHELVLPNKQKKSILNTIKPFGLNDLQEAQRNKCKILTSRASTGHVTWFLY